MKLTDKQVKAVRFIEKPIKIYDGGGLHLHTTKTAKTWRLSYRYGGKSREFTIGPYPLISLKEARVQRDEAKRLLLDGNDPVQHRKAKQASVVADAAKQVNDAITVESVKDEWLENKLSDWAPSTAAKNLLRLKNLPQSFLARPIVEITPSDIMAVLLPIQARGTIDLAHRFKNDLLKRIFDRAVRNELIDSNPVQHPSVELKKRPQQTPLAHTTNLKRLGQLIARIDEPYQGDRSTECALRILPRVFTRPSQLLSAEWSEISLDDRLWVTPAHKVKMRREHVTPLSRQVLELLREQLEYSGNGNLVFPSQITGRSLSSNALTLALRRLGFKKEEITAHGFRHCASSLLNEKEFVVDNKARKFSADSIERQLAHVDSTVRGIYNRSEYIDERIVLMQAWADFLDQLKAGANE